MMAPDSATVDEVLSVQGQVYLATQFSIRMKCLCATKKFLVFIEEVMKSRLEVVVSLWVMKRSIGGYRSKVQASWATEEASAREKSAYMLLVSFVRQ